MFESTEWYLLFDAYSINLIATAAGIIADNAGEIGKPCQLHTFPSVGFNIQVYE